MKKITLSVLLFFFNILSYAQFSVDVSSLIVNSVNAKTITFGPNVSKVNIALTVSINASSIPSDSYPGDIVVYYKKNSSTSTSRVIPSGGYGGQVLFLGGYNATRSFQFALNSSEFDNTSGFLYVEYKSYSGVPYKSSNIDVIKASVTIPTTPTTPTNPATPTNPIDLRFGLNQIVENQTINEGEFAGVLVGSAVVSNSPNSYNFTYQWMEKVNGDFKLLPIAGATNKDYWPSELVKTTVFVRQVTRKSVAGINGGDGTNLSNFITVTVIPAPELKNNTITLNGSIIKGSMPTGGIGSYQYSWMLWGAEDPYTFPNTGENLELTESIYNYLNSYPNLTIVRYVTSGRQTSSSSRIKLLPISLPVQPIQNNTISISGYQVTGSVPTGGAGDYRYSWFLGSNTEDPIWFEETTKDLNLTPYQHAIDILQNDPYAVLFRIVNSITSSNSNKINLYGASALKLQTLRGGLEDNSMIVYPNPTTESVNFSTNFSNNKEIEIVVYSDKLQNEKSVFKGTVIPNQIVNWNIPAGYQKGLYFYKILSGSKEVKTGKIIVQ